MEAEKDRFNLPQQVGRSDYAALPPALNELVLEFARENYPWLRALPLSAAMPTLIARK